MLIKLNRFLPYLCFIVSALYSYFVIYLKGSNDSFPTIVFILFLLYAFYVEVKNLNEKPIDSRCTLFRFAGYNISLYLGIITGFLLAGAPEKSLWMMDSYTMHIPGSVNIANVLHGTSSIRDTSSVFDKIYTIHYWTGLWFWLFGVFPAISSLSMLPIKSLTSFLIFLLGKKIYGPKDALIASLIYIFMPTVLFYTTAFYKESIVHLIIAALYLSIYAIFLEKKYWYLFLLLPSLYFLSNERFYLFPFFLGTILLLILGLKTIPLKLKLAVCLIALGVIALFIRKYQGQIPFENIMYALRVFRANYNSYSDVNPAFNTQLLYPLAFIKLIFTPYFTLNKFKMFFDFSYLLIWGSLINQFLIFLGLFEMLRTIKKNYFFGLPFLSFLALFAYIAPYNGRLRDSFYPILIIFSISGFKVIFSYLKNHSRFIKNGALAIILISSFFPSTSLARYFWSAEVSLFNISTQQQIDTASHDDILYATMTNGATENISLVISKKLKWESYYHFEQFQTLLAPKIVTFKNKAYLFYLEKNTSTLRALSIENLELSHNLILPIKSSSSFEVTSNQQQILIANDSQLYTFDGLNSSKITALPLNKGDQVASICSVNNKIILFFQKENDSKIWVSEFFENKWTRHSFINSVSSDFLPTIKCIDNKIFATILKKSLVNLNHHSSNFLLLSNNYELLETIPLNITTTGRVNFSMIEKNKGGFFPRFLYKNIESKAMHFEGQVQSRPGVLESLFNFK